MKRIIIFLLNILLLTIVYCLLLLLSGKRSLASVYLDNQPVLTACYNVFSLLLLPSAVSLINLLLVKLVFEPRRLLVESGLTVVCSVAIVYFAGSLIGNYFGFNTAILKTLLIVAVLGFLVPYSEMWLTSLARRQSKNEH